MPVCSTMVALSRLACVLRPLVLTIALPIAVAEDARPPIEAVLSTRETTYVIGQPVLLDLTVESSARDTVYMWEVLVDNVEPEIQMYVSSDNQIFEQYTVGIFPVPKGQRHTTPFRPGESKSYQLRLLYTHEQPDRIGFGAPGDYWIKVRYPLMMPKPKPFKRLEIESNTVKVTLERPTGSDAKLWEIIQAPEYLYFLQSGLVQGEHKEVVEAAIKILTELPESAYHPAFRWALNEYYTSERNRVTFTAQIEHGEAIRKALGIEEEVYFDVPRDPARPRDKRLERFVTYGSGVQRPPGEVPVTYGSTGRFSLEDLLRDASRQSGVELRLDKDISPISSFRSPPKTTMLRQFMQALVEPGRTTWVRDGDAYVLTLVPEAAADSPDRKEPAPPADPPAAPHPDRATENPNSSAP